jgi:hypothetical protein
VTDASEVAEKGAGMRTLQPRAMLAAASFSPQSLEKRILKYSDWKNKYFSMQSLPIPVHSVHKEGSPADRIRGC